jgi:hypothetical protein
LGCRSGGCSLAARGHHFLANRDLRAQLIDGAVQFFALLVHFGQAAFGNFKRPGKLQVFLSVHVIKVENLADLFQADAKPLAAQDQFQAGTVTARKAVAGLATGKSSSFCS